MENLCERRIQKHLCLSPRSASAPSSGGPPGRCGCISHSEALVGPPPPSPRTPLDNQHHFHLRVNDSGRTLFDRRHLFLEDYPVLIGKYRYLSGVLTLVGMQQRQVGVVVAVQTAQSQCDELPALAFCSFFPPFPYKKSKSVIWHDANLPSSTLHYPVL